MTSQVSASTSPPPYLDVLDLVSGYGQKRVVNGVSLHVLPGEVVALIGPNGAGKSTLLKAIFGLTPVCGGIVRLNGSAIVNCSPPSLVRLGMSYVPQGSRVFPDMTVRENLEMGGFAVVGGRLSEQIADMELLFPLLAERKRQVAGRLSGGEKQMLALAQALMTNPQMLLLDEPSLGLSPQATAEALSSVGRLNTELGTAVLLVEQNVREALRISDRVYVLRQGEVVLEALSATVSIDTIKSAFFGGGQASTS